MSDDRPFPEYFLEKQDEAYRRVVALRVANLRALADDLEREGLRVTLETGALRFNEVLTMAPKVYQHPYADAAHNFMHKLFWGIANLSTESIIHEAAEADEALRGYRESISGHQDDAEAVDQPKGGATG